MSVAVGEALTPWREPEREGEELRVTFRHTLAARDVLDPAHAALGEGALAAGRYRVRLVLVNDANTPRDVTLWARAAGVPGSVSTDLAPGETTLAGDAPLRLGGVRCVPHSETPVEITVAATACTLISEPEEL